MKLGGAALLACAALIAIGSSTGSWIVDGSAIGLTDSTLGYIGLALGLCAALGVAVAGALCLAGAQARVPWLALALALGLALVVQVAFLVATWHRVAGDDWIAAGYSARLAILGLVIALVTELGIYWPLRASIRASAARSSRRGASSES